MEQILLPNTLSYLICPSVTKLAMLSVLYRINPSSIYRSVVVAIAVAIFAYTAAICIVTGAPCNPLKEGSLTCLQNVALSQASLNIASDFAVLAVPIPTIHRLQLSLKQKVSLGCLLALGSAFVSPSADCQQSFPFLIAAVNSQSSVVICSIARLPYVIVLPGVADATYSQAILGIWSIVEVNLGIMCACAMRLKPLITTYFPQLQLFSSRSRSRSRGNTSGNRLTGKNSKSQHSYQLHSVQKGSVAGTDNSGRDIHVYRSYKVDVEEDRVSTDKILHRAVPQF